MASQQFFRSSAGFGTLINCLAGTDVFLHYDIPNAITVIICIICHYIKHKNKNPYRLSMPPYKIYFMMGDVTQTSTDLMLFGETRKIKTILTIETNHNN